MCLANCSMVNLLAISSALVGILIPILQVNLRGGDATRICTSLAPASLSNFMIGPIVVPLTIESSIRIILLPATFSTIAPNFLATPNLLSRALG